jgi:hypothetical protein
MVISITITESANQVLPGIPSAITLSTNEPATIFYTLDGGIPDTFSPVYVSPIALSDTSLSVVLTIFATNGIDSSTIITQSYQASIDQLPTISGDRLPHSAVSNLNSSNMNSLFPFGTPAPLPDSNYLNPADAGTTIFNPKLPATPSGFDGDGNPAGFVNNPSDQTKFNQIYSTSDNEGQVFPGVGNLPAKVEIIGKQSAVEYVQTQSSTSDKLFNPKALVIYQDTTTEDPSNPVITNRPYFSLENQEIVKDGVLLMNSALDQPTTTGSFLKSYHNPRTNMITSYYYDNAVGRWIISSYPFQPNQANVGVLSGMVFRRPSESPGAINGNGFIFNWYPFLGRKLI